MLTRALQFLLRLFSVTTAMVVGGVLIAPGVAAQAEASAEAARPVTKTINVPVLVSAVAAEHVAAVTPVSFPTANASLPVVLVKPKSTPTKRPVPKVASVRPPQGGGGVTPSAAATVSVAASQPPRGGSSASDAKDTGQVKPSTKPKPPVQHVTPKPKPVSDVSKIAQMINFAKDQLGEPYSSPGNSVSTWDCSGLTKAAFAHAGIYIGTHSATNQYQVARERGDLVPYSDKRTGDLIFWSDGGGDMYHVAIYLGAGLILEAADYGKPVRIHTIWGSPYGQVARFA